MRPAPVVLPLLRQALADVSVGSWTPDVDYRTFPLVTVRRAGGTRLRRSPRTLSLPEVDLAVYSSEGLAEAEELYEDVLDALYEAQRRQTLTEAGYLHSITETQGATQAPSPFADTWSVEGIVRLGIRPTP